MANDILIRPTASKIEFSGSAHSSIRLEVQDSGSVVFQGSSGSLFGITDSMSGSLFSVNDVSGLPIMEVFSDDKITLGRYQSPIIIDQSGSISGSLTSTASFGKYVGVDSISDGSATSFSGSITSTGSFGKINIVDAIGKLSRITSSFALDVGPGEATITGRSYSTLKLEWKNQSNGVVYSDHTMKSTGHKLGLYYGGSYNILDLQESNNSYHAWSTTNYIASHHAFQYSASRTSTHKLGAISASGDITMDGSASLSGSSTSTASFGKLEIEGDQFSRVVLENGTHTQGCEIDFTTNGNDWYVAAGGSGRPYFENKFFIYNVTSNGPAITIDSSNNIGFDSRRSPTYKVDNPGTARTTGIHYFESTIQQTNNNGRVGIGMGAFGVVPSMSLHTKINNSHTASGAYLHDVNSNYLYYPTVGGLLVENMSDSGSTGGQLQIRSAGQYSSSVHLYGENAGVQGNSRMSLWTQYEGTTLERITLEPSGAVKFGDTVTTISGSITSTGSFGALNIDGGLFTSASLAAGGGGGGGQDTDTTDTVTFAGITSTGDIRANGDIIASQYIVSSSITHTTQSFSSGSTIFGDTIDDTHEFTGSVNITGSLALTGNSASLEVGGDVSGSIISTGSFGYLDLGEGEIAADRIGINGHPNATGVGLAVHDKTIVLRQSSGNDSGTALAFCEASLTDNSFVIAHDGSGSGRNNKLKFKTYGNVTAMELYRDKALVIVGNVTASGDISGSITSTGSFGALRLNGPEGKFVTTKVGTAALGTTTPVGSGLTIYPDGSAGGTSLGNVYGLGISHAGSSNGYYLIHCVSGVGSVFAIHNGGSVGIGNTNSTYKLDVSGTGRFTGKLTTADVSGSITSTGSFGRIQAGPGASKISGSSISLAGAQVDVLTLNSVNSGAGGGGVLRFITTANDNTLGRISVVDESNYAAGFSFQTNKTGGNSDTTTEIMRLSKAGHLFLQDGVSVSGSSGGFSGSIDSTGSFGVLNVGGGHFTSASLAAGGGGGAITALNNATANELVTVGSTTTELDAETLLTWNGSVLGVGIASPSIVGGIHVKNPGSQNNIAIFESSDAYISMTMKDTDGQGYIEYHGANDQFNFSSAAGGAVPHLQLSNSKISGSLTSTGSFGKLVGDGSSLTGVSAFPYNSTTRADVTGSMHISSSVGTATASLVVEGSGSEVFTVKGTNGTLFSVSDELSGSLFAVTNVAGLPVVEAFSNNKVNLGPFSKPVGVTDSGSLTVSGSMTGVVVSMSIASNTASMDARLSNFFHLQLASGADTYLTASNISPGQSINLQVTQQATSGTISYSDQFKFPNGMPYAVSATGSGDYVVTDLVSFVSFDSQSLFGTALKNLT